MHMLLCGEAVACDANISVACDAFFLLLVTLFMSRCISHAQARAKCVSVFLACDAPLFVACDAVYLDAYFACAGACKVRVSVHGKCWGRALCVHISVKSGSFTGSS